MDKHRKTVITKRHQVEVVIFTQLQKESKDRSLLLKMAISFFPNAPKSGSNCTTPKDISFPFERPLKNLGKPILTYLGKQVAKSIFLRTEDKISRAE